jgi:flagellin
MYINTNVAALFAQNSLNNTQNSLNALQQEMSTGLQINSPADNPSGLAISNLMQGEIGGINSAVNNATQANNLLNVANGGMQTDVQIVQEIQQLAVQASNSTNNLQDTQDIQNQINQLLQTLDNVAQTLNYNNQAVLSQGATGGAPVLSSVDQVAYGTASTPFIDVADASAALGTYSVVTQASATFDATVAASSVVTSMTDNTFASVGLYSLALSVGPSTSGVNDVTVTVALDSGSTVLGTTTFQVASTAIASTTAGATTVNLDGNSVTVNYASLTYSDTATAPTVVNVTVSGTYSVAADVYSGTTVIGSLSYATTVTAPLTGLQSIAVTGATVGLNLSSIASALTYSSTNSDFAASLTQDYTISSPLQNLQVGADSGNIAAGLYTVSMYYASTTGADYVTITGPNGYSATGSVSNLSNAAGTLTLQLVSGSNMTGNNSFVLTVNQTDLHNASSTAPIVQSVSVSAAQQYTFQTGPTQGNGNAISLGFGSFSSASLGLTNIDVTNTQGAQYAITQAQQALSILTNAQGQVGAQVDQLNYTISNLQTQTTNLQASQSSIMDANMAQVTSQFAQQQILMQTGIQALSTAQQLPSLVLKLLS